MNPEVNIQNFQKFNIPNNIEQTVYSSLSVLNENMNTTVNISFVDEVEMTTLNNNFRNIQSSTDVLSFEAGIIDPENGKTILGDIVICYPYVTQQANDSKNDINDELRLMVIHGLLHLLGYDHDDLESKQIMWEKQNQILLAENIFLNRIPE